MGRTITVGRDNWYGDSTELHLDDGEWEQMTRSQREELCRETAREHFALWFCSELDEPTVDEWESSGESESEEDSD